MKHLTIDLAAYANRLFRVISNPPPKLRWVECEDCDGQGYCLKWTGSDGWREEVERTCCSCTDGYMEIDEGDSRWGEGTEEHPND